jgi:hypothetical protein
MGEEISFSEEIEKKKLNKKNYVLYIFFVLMVSFL